ncbi:hypothetical protein HPB47_018957 [Ixodes persulcatus]|uniref:Uncharacterized protein n=1 Tax=Ixodes persulcatus TaxID=34615 RepID=A0AC60QN30_IXOPE|nr:hypothetical protein HPB47_018957 [Ixodes persulcatus]
MAMAYVDIYIYWSFVSPHERGTIPVERTNQGLMTRKKIENLTSTPGVSCIFSSLMILFTVGYLRFLIVDGLVRRTSVLSVLTVGILASTAATIKNDDPIYYAIPVAVAASSNVVMPSTIPMVIVHELARIQPYSLVS